MSEHPREALTKPIQPAELTDPGFWATFLPDLVDAEDSEAWSERLEPDFPDGVGMGGRVISPELMLTLPHGLTLVLQFYKTDVYYYLEGADLPDDGLLGHNDCHCQLPIFRWLEVRALAQVLQAANPSLPPGAALLLLEETFLPHPSEHAEIIPALQSSLNALQLKLRDTFSLPPEVFTTRSSPGRFELIPFFWWENAPGDWVNNGMHSLRSVTTYEDGRWSEATREKFNRVLHRLGINTLT